MKKLFFLVLMVNLVYLSSPAQPFNVDKVTGTGSFVLPLFTIGDKNLSHSTSLYYSAKSIDVSSMSSDVGQNWNLIASLEIVRLVRGYPDDLNETSRKGWLYCNNPTLIEQFEFGSNLEANCTSSLNSFNFINSIIDKDTSPDIYYYAIPGYTGSFTFDNTGSIDSITLINFEDVKVKAVKNLENSRIQGFEITNPKGEKYIFYENETEHHNVVYADQALINSYFNDHDQQKVKYHDDIVFNSKWKLSRITNYSNENLTFDYSVITDEHSIPFNPYINFLKQNIYSIKVAKTEKLLTSINSAYSKISFYYIPSDFTENKVLLKSVKQEFKSSNNSIIKTDEVLLDYGMISKDRKFLRPFLKEVTFLHGCEKKQPYRFEYKEVDFVSMFSELPEPGSNRVDYWGNFNNTNTPYEVPKLYVYPNLQGFKKISPYKIEGQQTEVILDGALMKTNSFNQVGILTSIEHPKGAKTTIDYETNIFYNHINNKYDTGAGVRVKKITVKDQVGYSKPISITYKYENSAGESSGVLIGIPIYHRISNSYREQKAYKYIQTEGGLSYKVYDPEIMNNTINEQYLKLTLRFRQNLDNNSLIGVRYNSVKQFSDTLKGYTQFLYDIPYKYGDTHNVGSRVYSTSEVAKQFCVQTAINYTSYHPTIQFIDNFSSGIGILKKVIQFGASSSTPQLIRSFKYQDIAIKPKLVKFFLAEKTNGGSIVWFSVSRILANRYLRLIESIDSIRDNNTLSNNYFVKKNFYTYKDNTIRVSEILETKSNGKKKLTKTIYSGDFKISESEVMDDFTRAVFILNRNNIKDMPLEISVYELDGSNEICLASELKVMKNFGTTDSPNILAEKIFNVSYPDGKSSFNKLSMSLTNGIKKFDFSTDYNLLKVFNYNQFGKLISISDSKSVLNSYQRDIFTGEAILSIDKAKPSEVIYSNFDNETDYSFSQIGFNVSDKSVAGRTGKFGLSGFGNNGKKLRKSFIKKAGYDYSLSGFFKSEVSNCNQIKIDVQNLQGSNIFSQTVTVPNAAINQWVYFADTLSFKSLPNEIIVEIYGNNSCISSIDDFTLAPINHIFERSVFDSSFGQTATIDINGKSIIKEFDNASRLKAIRNFENDIVKKYSYDNVVLNGSSAIGIIVPDMIVENTPFNVTALLNCLPYQSIKWKFWPYNNYIGGSEIQIIQNGLPAGINTITLRIEHPSYGSIEYTKTIVVSLKPISVSLYLEPNLSMPQGVQYINICASGYTPPVFGNYVDVYGPTLQYFYEWRFPGDENSGWYEMTSFPNFSCEVRLVVISSDGRIGISNSIEFFVYCEPPPGGGGTPIESGY